MRISCTLAISCTNRGSAAVLLIFVPVSPGRGIHQNSEGSASQAYMVKLIQKVQHGDPESRFHSNDRTVAPATQSVVRGGI